MAQSKVKVTLEDGKSYIVTLGDDVETPKPPKRGFGFGNMLMNIPGSAAKAGSDLVAPILHPIETVKGIGKLALGAGQKLIPGRQGYEENIEAAGEFYKERFKNPLKTLEEDPVGAMFDVGSVLSLGGGAATKAGKLGKLGNLQRVGQAATRAAGYVDPLSLAGKGASYAIGRKSPDAVRAAKIAAREGIELPVQAKIDSPFIGPTEALLESGVFSGKKLTEVRQKAEIGLDDFVKRSVEGISSIKEPHIAGQMAKQGLANFSKMTSQIRDRLYKAVSPRLRTVEPVLDSTKAALKSIVERRESKLFESPEVQKLNKILAGLEGETVPSNLVDAKGKVLTKQLPSKADTFEELRKFRTNIFDKANPPALGKTGFEREWEILYKAISTDLDATAGKLGADVQDAFKKANKFNAARQKMLENAVVQRIYDVAEPGKIVDFAFSGPETVKITKSVIGKDNFQSLKAAFMDKIVKKSMTARKGEDEIFNANAFRRNLKNVGDETLREIFTPDELARIEEIKVLGKQLGKGEYFRTGSPTGKFFRLLQSFTRPATLIPEALATPFFITKPGRRFLTEGLPAVQRFTRPPIGPLSFQAGRAARTPYSDENEAGVRIPLPYIK